MSRTYPAHRLFPNTSVTDVLYLGKMQSQFVHTTSILKSISKDGFLVVEWRDTMVLQEILLIYASGILELWDIEVLQDFGTNGTV